MENVLDDQRLEDIELKVTVAAADAYRHLIAHDLGAGHPAMKSK